MLNDLQGLVAFTGAVIAIALGCNGEGATTCPDLGENPDFMRGVFADEPLNGVESFGLQTAQVSCTVTQVVESEVGLTCQATSGDQVSAMLVDTGVERSLLNPGDDVQLALAYWQEFEVMTASVTSVIDESGRTRYASFELSGGASEEVMTTLLGEIAGDLRIEVAHGETCSVNDEVEVVRALVSARSNSDVADVLGPGLGVPLGAGTLDVHTAVIQEDDHPYGADSARAIWITYVSP